MGLFIGLYSSPTGELLADLTPRITGAQFSDNEHGFERFDGFYPCSLQESFRLWQYRGAGWVRVTWNGYTAWEGRMEDPRIVNGGIHIGALGAVRAFYDAPYTRAWSQTRLDDWRFADETHVNHKPQKYDSDQQARLAISLKKNEIYGPNVDAFIWYSSAPACGGSWSYADISYSFNLPSSWTFRHVIWDGDTSFTNVALSPITTSGGSVASSATWNFSASPRAAYGFQIYNSSAGSFTNTAESGTYYLRVTSARLTSNGSSPNVYANTIFADLTASIAALNSSQLQNVTAQVINPGVDLFNEIYEDAYPGDIASRLAGYGGSAGSLWEWGVWEDRIPYFRQRSSAARTWYVDAASIDLDGSIERLRNSAYAVYRDAGGRNQRTAAGSSGTSIATFGLTRRAAVNVNTTASAQAVYQRDAFLNDSANPKPRAALTFDRLFDSGGAQYPLFMLRAGDTLTARNLPPTLSTDIDRIRSFRVSRKTYDIDADVLTCEPEDPPPYLDVLIARAGNISE